MKALASFDPAVRAARDFAQIADADVAAALDYPSLVTAIAGAFVNPAVAPRRAVVQVYDPPGGTRTLLVMPAVRPGGIAITKLVTVLTGRDQGVHSQLLAFRCDGTLIAMIDGHSLTARRTAAASVLAARTLKPDGVRSIAVLGAGRQARAQAEAYCACFSIDQVKIWSRRPEAAMSLAGQLARGAGRVVVASSPREATLDADIVTAATMATSPLLTAAYLQPGTHVDLVGGFRPEMREADDSIMARATVVADGPAALEEAGDLAGPLSSGCLKRSDVQLLGDILSRSGSLVRRGDITVFKSVGHAAEDMVATELLLQRLGLLVDVAG